MALFDFLFKGSKADKEKQSGQKATSPGARLQKTTAPGTAAGAAAAHPATKPGTTRPAGTVKLTPSARHAAPVRPVASRPPAKAAPPSQSETAPQPTGQESSSGDLDSIVSALQQIEQLISEEEGAEQKAGRDRTMSPVTLKLADVVRFAAPIFAPNVSIPHDETVEIYIKDLFSQLSRGRVHASLKQLAQDIPNEYLRPDVNQIEDKNIAVPLPLIVAALDPMELKKRTSSVAKEMAVDGIPTLFKPAKPIPSAPPKPEQKAAPVRSPAPATQPAAQQPPAAAQPRPVPTPAAAEKVAPPSVAARAETQKAERAAPAAPTVKPVEAAAASPKPAAEKVELKPEAAPQPTAALKAERAEKPDAALTPPAAPTKEPAKPVVPAEGPEVPAAPAAAKAETPKAEVPPVRPAEPGAAAPKAPISPLRLRPTTPAAPPAKQPAAPAAASKAAPQAEVARPSAPVVKPPVTPEAPKPKPPTAPAKTQEPTPSVPTAEKPAPVAKEPTAPHPPVPEAAVAPKTQLAPETQKVSPPPKPAPPSVSVPIPPAAAPGKITDFLLGLAKGPAEEPARPVPPLAKEVQKAPPPPAAAPTPPPVPKAPPAAAKPAPPVVPAKPVAPAAPRPAIQKPEPVATASAKPAAPAPQPIPTITGSGKVPPLMHLGIDLNSASAEEITARLEGIGRAMAERIVDDREKNGPFYALYDLARVDGIGARIFEKITGWKWYEDIYGQLNIVNQVLDKWDGGLPNLNLIAQRFNALSGFDACVILHRDGHLLASSWDEKPSQAMEAMGPQIVKRVEQYMKNVCPEDMLSVTIFMHERVVILSQHEDIIFVGIRSPRALNRRHLQIVQGMAMALGKRFSGLRDAAAVATNPSA